MIVRMERLTAVEGLEDTAPTWRRSVAQAARGLRTLTARQWAVAVVVSIGFGVILGLATVLIPNSFFTRDIPPVWWNYPVWILTSVFSGILFATYVRDGVDPRAAVGTATGADDDKGADDGKGADDSKGADDDRQARRTSRAGMAGAFIAWFAVGCPVCNKFALLALGYSGAITWFAPFQPVLAVLALVLVGIALVVRLRGRVVCALPSVAVEEVAR